MSPHFLVGRSNELSAKLIAHLAEVDARKLYLEEAQPSMFAWCIAELGCSEDVAYNWITVARASKKWPSVLDSLRCGKVHLTGLRLLAPHLSEENHKELLVEASGKSKREIEELIAMISPKPPVPSSIRKLPARQEPSSRTNADCLSRRHENGGCSSDGQGRGKQVGLPDGHGRPLAHEPPSEVVAPKTTYGHATDGNEQAGALRYRGVGNENGRDGDTIGNSNVEPELVLGHSSAEDNVDCAVRTAGLRSPAASPQRRGAVEPLSEEAYKVTFTASRSLRDKLRQARDLLGHQVADGDLGEIVERGLDLLIADVRKTRFGTLRRKGSAARNNKKGKKGNSVHGGSKKKSAAKSKEQSENERMSERAAESANRSVEPLKVAVEDRPSPARNERNGEVRAKSRPVDKGRKRRSSRYIPVDIRRAVLERDGEQCTFVDE